MEFFEAEHDISESTEQLTNLRKIVVGDFSNGVSYSLGQEVRIQNKTFTVSHIYYDDNRAYLGLMPIYVLHITNTENGDEQRWKGFPEHRVFSFEWNVE